MEGISFLKFDLTCSSRDVLWVMAVLIEGFAVLAKWEVIEPLIEERVFEIPNNTALNDGLIWCCNFMAKEDALKVLNTLAAKGLNTSQGPDSDVVLMDEYDGSVDPYCEWISSSRWEKALIAWKKGTSPDSVTAREGWDPKKGSGLKHHRGEGQPNLRFLRLEGNVEVYFDEDLKEEVYVGRTSAPVESLYKLATDVILKNSVAAGQPKLKGDAMTAVEDAVQSLKTVVEERPDWWNAHWFLGKGQVALGRHELAYASFHAAYAIEKGVEAIPKELGGVCLALGRFEEAVEVGERCLALNPDSHELLGNLAVSYLLAGRVDEAAKALEYARKINDKDQINKRLGTIASQIISGEREQPQSLAELMKPATTQPTKRKPFWKFW